MKRTAARGLFAQRVVAVLDVARMAVQELQERSHEPVPGLAKFTGRLSPGGSKSISLLAHLMTPTFEGRCTLAAACLRPAPSRAYAYAGIRRLFAERCELAASDANAS